MNLPPVEERISTRARRVRVEVRRDGAVWLVIPQGGSRRAAYAFLATRREWIERARRRVLEAGAPASRAQLAWDGTDRLPLAGRDVALLRVASRMARVRVRFAPDRVEVFAAPTMTTAYLQQALRAALRERVRGDAMRLLSAEAARLQVDYRGPRIADQRSLWGSCAASGLISLNWRLVFAPPAVLRYVVVHELCHRVHGNHSRAFWDLVARQLPDYQTQRAWLRVHGAQLHGVLPTS